MRPRGTGIVVIAALLAGAAVWAQGIGVKTGLPAPIVPEGFGINIHFTDPQPAEMARFAEAGYRVARMDFFWGGIEKEKGKYDFSAYDRLAETLAKAGARPLFILDYGNDLYQKGSPSTPEARAAFARFAAEAARHFKGKNVLWEVWNEPNIQFWQPKPNANDYAQLAIATAKAVHQADPDAVVLAPGSSTFPWEYLETVFKAGLLAEIDGVSVHPYRESEPESAAADFARLRALIARYAPAARRQMPIISSEWGYSTHERGNISEATQAAYLTRMWLANLASGVNLSIFYDWRDDGDDPKENEHRFGTVRRDFTPKPSFLAARKLIQELSGYTFRHRLAPKTPEDWRLLFQKGDTDDLALVSWNAGQNAPDAERAPTLHRLTATDPDFAALKTLASIRFPYGPIAVGGVKQKPTVPLSFAPDFRLTGVTSQTATGKLTLRFTAPTPGAANAALNTSWLPVTMETVRRDWETLPVSLSLIVEGKPLPAVAPLTLVRTDPLLVSVAPTADSLAVTLQNPGGTPFNGRVRLHYPGSEVAMLWEEGISLRSGDTQATVSLPFKYPDRPVAVEVAEKGTAVVRTPAARFLPFPGWPTKAGADSGFHRVLFVENAAQKPEPLTVAAPPSPKPGEGAFRPAPVALKFDYQFDKGWRYAEASPVTESRIPDGATALVVWVYSDGTGDALRVRFKDSTGQTFQKDLGAPTWHGWRAVTIPLDGSGPGVSWGGANDRSLHPPLTWDSLALVDSTDRENAHSGTLYLAAPYYRMAEKPVPVSLSP